MHFCNNRRGLAAVGLVSLLLAVACGAGSDRPAADAALGDASSDSTDAFDPGDARGDLDAGGDAIAAAPCPSPPPTAVVDVTVGELYDRITADAPLAIVDVREPSETAGGIIEDALTYPWNSGVLAADHADLPDDVPLFVICRSGGRSGPASQFLFESGHTCVHDVLGGMNAWDAAGYPTVIP